jgi:exodeoxyribonuclease V beta subunit
MQRLESDRSAVQIMTIHKAKGLEAPLVFLAGGLTAGGSDGERARVYHEGGRRLAWVGSPSAEVKPIIDREEREEEQRLMYVALTRAMGRLYLPCVRSGDGELKSMRGPYDPVNRRVHALIKEGDPRVVVEDVDAVSLAPRPAVPGAPWRPAPELLREDHDGARYSALRERHAAAVVTSYTRLRTARATLRSRWAAPAEEPRVEKAAAAVDELPATTLRAARSSGIFLHELLERAPLPSFVPRGTVDEWRARVDVGALFDEALAAHRIDPAQREHAEQLVWTAYTAPVALPGGGQLDGFAAAGVLAREMEFVYPIPRPAHPAIGDDPGAPLSGAHGYVRGSLDLAFEHKGLTYFADWKSDSLASYAPDALARHVAAHYMDQAKLYALAVVRLLGVRSRADHEARFGGLLYCFLRGFGETGGLWSARPGWDEIVAWEESLRARRDWGRGRG